MLYSLMQDLKFSVWIHIGVAECCILFLGNCDLDLVHSLRKIVCRAYIVNCFKEGLPNLECGYILGCQSVPYCFGVTLTLTSGTSPILLEGESQISVWLHLGVAECHTLFLYITLTLTAVLIYENLLSLGHFSHIITQFTFLSDNQLSNSVFIGCTTLFSP